MNNLIFPIQHPLQILIKVRFLDLMGHKTEWPFGELSAKSEIPQYRDESESGSLHIFFFALSPDFIEVAYSFTSLQI